MAAEHAHVRAMRSAAVPSPAESAREGVGGPGQNLPGRAELERRFPGADLSTVRVHTGQAAEHANARLRSRAYTRGEHIAVAAVAGSDLLAHEVAHVLQQRGQTTDGVGAPAGPAAERAAERAADSPRSRTQHAGSSGGSSGRAERAPAVVQLAPNRAGTTDPSHVVAFVRSHETGAGSAPAVMDALSEAHGGNTDRYFYTRTYGWVDVRHFGRAASLAASVGSVVTEALGVGNEALQWVSEWGDAYRSGFSPEDIPSNAAGAAFGDDYIGSRAGETTADALDRWMTDNGALPAAASEAGRASLPATDPSERGGAGRGSSNVSRTRSTLSGDASQERESVEAGARQLNDPWAWMRALGG